MAASKEIERVPIFLSYIFLVLVVIPKDAAASSRSTPWLYQPRTMTKGEVEYEQWDNDIIEEMILKSKLTHEQSIAVTAYVRAVLENSLIEN